MIEVVSVHRGVKQDLKVGRRTVSTGIYKAMVSERVTVDLLGLEGDVVCDQRHHGGTDQAVYVYTVEDYEYWARQYQQPFTPGAFGENLCVGGMNAAQLDIGDRLLFADLVLEVTAPRIPCSVLAAAVDVKNFAEAFKRAARPGFYCRVITPGTIAAGDLGTLQQSLKSKTTLLEVYRANYDPGNRQVLSRLLALPIDVRTRLRFNQKLASLKR
jgi:MOSC domain-containing protein YiiM